MGSHYGLFFDNIQVGWEENAVPSLCRVLFRPADFQQVSHRKLPAQLRRWHARSLIRPDAPIYTILHGSAAAAECRLSILGYSRSRAKEAWNSAKTEVLLNPTQDDDTSPEIRQWKKLVANGFAPISYEEWQKKYAEILRAKAINPKFHDSGAFILLEGLKLLTEMASDPLMWVAIQVYAFEPTELWADITDIIEGEDEAKESIFGDNDVSNRLSYAFGKITLLTEGVTDSRILKVSLTEFYPRREICTAS